jgi:membrane protein required for colicin V production
MRDVPNLGFLDRTVGLGFGLVRGLVALGGIVLVFQMATPDDRRPEWITQGALYPVSASAANVLRSIAPRSQRLAGRVGPVLQHAVTTGEVDNSAWDATDDRRRPEESTVERSR